MALSDVARCLAPMDLDGYRREAKRLVRAVRAGDERPLGRAEKVYDALVELE